MAGARLARVARDPHDAVASVVLDRVRDEVEQHLLHTLAIRERVMLGDALGVGAKAGRTITSSIAHQHYGRLAFVSTATGVNLFGKRH